MSLEDRELKKQPNLSRFGWILFKQIETEISNLQEQRCIGKIFTLSDLSELQFPTLRTFRLHKTMKTYSGGRVVRHQHE